MSTVLLSHENWLVITELPVFKFYVLLASHSIKISNIVLYHFTEKCKPLDMVISSMIVIFSNMKIVILPVFIGKFTMAISHLDKTKLS